METAFQKNAFQDNAFQIELVFTGTIQTTSAKENTLAEGKVINPDRGDIAPYWKEWKELPKDISLYVETRQAKQQSRSYGKVTPVIRGKIGSIASKSTSNVSGYTDESDEEILQLVLQLVEM